MRKVAGLLLPGWHSHDTAAVDAAMDSSSVNPLLDSSSSAVAATATASAAANAAASSEACVGGLLHPGAADAVRCFQAFLDAGERRFGLPTTTTAASTRETTTQLSHRVRTPAVLVATSTSYTSEDLPASSSSPPLEPPSPLKPPSEPPSPQPEALLAKPPPPSNVVSAETAATLSIDDVEVLLLACRIAALEAKILAEHPRLMHANERVNQLLGALVPSGAEEEMKPSPQLDRGGDEEERRDDACPVPPPSMHDWSGEAVDAGDESTGVGKAARLAMHQAATAAASAVASNAAAIAIGAAAVGAEAAATGAGAAGATPKKSMGLSLDTSWVPAGHFTFDIETGAGVGLSKTLRVTRVDVGSDAARAGVARGFRLVSFDGAAVTTLEAFKEALQFKRDAQINSQSSGSSNSTSRGYSVEFERPAVDVVGVENRAKQPRPVPHQVLVDDSSGDEHSYTSEVSGPSHDRIVANRGEGSSSQQQPQQPQVPLSLKQRRSAKAAAAKAKISMQRAAQVIACRVLTLPALNGLIETFLQSINDDDAVGAAALKAATAAAAETSSDLAHERSDDEEGDERGSRKMPVACAAATTLTFLAQFMNWMSSAVAEGCRDFLKAEVERVGVQRYRLKRAASLSSSITSSSTTASSNTLGGGDIGGGGVEGKQASIPNSSSPSSQSKKITPSLLLPEEDEASWAEAAADAAVDGVRRAVEIEVFVPAARTLRRRLRAAEDLLEASFSLDSGSSSSSSRGRSGRAAASPAETLQRAYDILGRSPGNIGPRGGQAKLGLPPEHRSPSGWEPVSRVCVRLPCFP